MSEKLLPYKSIILGMMLLFGLFFVVLAKFSDHIGISLGDADNDEINIIGYCLAFVSVLFVVRIAHLVYFKRIDGDWTMAGKARWRYCLIGAVVVAFIGSVIQYLRIPELLGIILEILVAMGVAFYFFARYLDHFQNTTKNDRSARRP